jgi:hypothetical protein
MVVTKVNMNIIENRFDGAIVEIKGSCGMAFLNYYGVNEYI